jgi:hypothetical protein
MNLVSEAAIAHAAARRNGALEITVELAGAASWAGFEAARAGEDAAAVIVTGSNAETAGGRAGWPGPAL